MISNRGLMFLSAFLVTIQALDSSAVGGQDEGKAGSSGQSTAGQAGSKTANTGSTDEIAIRPSRTKSAAPRLLSGGFGRPRGSVRTPGRDAKGRLVRPEKAKDDFRKAHPCPATGKTSGPCPGYVIDHVVALKNGGADAPSNMQWQAVANAKAKGGQAQ